MDVQMSLSKLFRVIHKSKKNVMRRLEFENLILSNNSPVKAYFSTFYKNVVDATQTFVDISFVLHSILQLV